MEFLRGITNQLVEGGLVTFFDLENILAFVSLLEGTFETLAFASKGNVLRIDGQGEEQGGEKSS